MKFLGVRGNLHSRRSGRPGGRPSIPVWCNLPMRLTPVSRTNRLHPLAERQAQRALRKTGIIQSRPGCALLTFETIYRFGSNSLIVAVSTIPWLAWPGRTVRRDYLIGPGAGLDGPPCLGSRSPRSKPRSSPPQPDTSWLMPIPRLTGCEVPRRPL
jgi:hypothetical protein